MKLGVYTINGTKVTDLPTFDPSAIGSSPVFVDADPLPQDYTDVTTILHLDCYGMGSGADYKRVRAKIAELVASVGFSSLTTQEKEVASKWFVVGKSDRDTVHTASEQQVNGVKFHKCMIEARLARFRTAAIVIYNRLESADAKEVIGDINSEGLDVKFTEYGFEGSVEGDADALFDYIEARAGTNYSTTGLAAKAFIPTDGGTLQAVVDTVMDVLKRGVY